MKKRLGFVVVLLSLFLVGSYVYQQQAGYAGSFNVSISTPRGNDILVDPLLGRHGSKGLALARWRCRASQGTPR
ncbi:hypothetical protein CAI21_18380 [Alkalilimnicola ehrlichii]|uniref:Uncharacterized protein n=1 Tax=Alkalilimnicola ehrlichii TaxID=351052 RepID=A0A3E0WK16_9GAMM|nr:hypothetical protein [Alkalilimnicola ehrlichii]RFA25736.1 hypothetical protein CAI21_18380 [Alkalilimnicola ehrlichii]RFA32819.1 hypothetical protein CAL65_18630 [Alkalilimnicola ehrlichii]